MSERGFEGVTLLAGARDRPRVPEAREGIIIGEIVAAEEWERVATRPRRSR